jgi:hypothetical protein
VEALKIRDFARYFTADRAQSYVIEFRGLDPR